MKDFLIKYKPPLYISLHAPPLTFQEINIIITILERIYKNIYIFNNGKKKITKKELFYKNNIHLVQQELVFDDN